MRAAAHLAGITARLDDPALQLALEPECALIASAVEASADLQRRLVVGRRVMILDCGGGTVDVTVSEVIRVDPVQLSELLPASGDAWGGTYVDAQWRKAANALLAPPEGA